MRVMFATVSHPTTWRTSFNADHCILLYQVPCKCAISLVTMLSADSNMTQRYLAFTVKHSQRSPEREQQNQAFEVQFLGSVVFSVS